MIKEYYDLIIVGGGPAGMSAAISAFDNGVKDILLIERSFELGGILNQCIHHGFGVTQFHEELTGPAYANRLIREVRKRRIETLLRCMVIEAYPDKSIVVASPDEGIKTIRASGIIFAMGCRERTRESLTIPGVRCAGIYSAGTAQYLVNVEGYLPGKRIVILGSGDIGLIMARRLTLEGAQVVGVFEIKNKAGGLQRNITQCLDDYNIPLYLSTTITRINGSKRVRSVETAEVDENGRPLPGSERTYTCDTVLLSVGLIPETELSRSIGLKNDPVTDGPVVGPLMQTEFPGIYACGNVAHVHDVVDNVSIEAAKAGMHAAKYVLHTVQAGG